MKGTLAVKGTAYRWLLLLMDNFDVIVEFNLLVERLIAVLAFMGLCPLMPLHVIMHSILFLLCNTTDTADI
jgi:hypothetical protein